MVKTEEHIITKAEIQIAKRSGLQTAAKRSNTEPKLKAETICTVAREPRSKPEAALEFSLTNKKVRLGLQIAAGKAQIKPEAAREHNPTNKRVRLQVQIGGRAGRRSTLQKKRTPGEK